ncbi:hypothetical protein [Haladaptatus halobius]|uniref:hypothetical protein n=1 Tax=Haladaptatus halobius TaxID=2884875 RepID=UPI001D0B2BDB|nr:hypothetical protein [Haladaptatus halobius]
MATHDTLDGFSNDVTLPNVVPFDLTQLTRLSWELGSQTVENNDSARHSQWKHEKGWALSIFQATSNTVILRISTPVGREQFYGAAQMDLNSALPGLNSAPHWQQDE